MNPIGGRTAAPTFSTPRSDLRLRSVCQMGFSESLGRVKHSLGFRLFVVGLLLAFEGGVASWIVNPRSNPTAYADGQRVNASTVSSVQPADGGWQQLSAPEQQALLPLREMWPTLRDAQQEKWRLLAAGFQGKSASEQRRVHARMAAWARLSPHQRAQTRLAFLEGATIYDRKRRIERWNAYRQMPSTQRPQVAAANNPRIVSRASLHATSGATTMLMPQFFPLPVYGQVAQARATGQ